MVELAVVVVGRVGMGECMCVCMWMGNCVPQSGTRVKGSWGSEGRGGLDDERISAFHTTTGLVCACWGWVVFSGTGDWRWEGVDKEKDRTIDKKNTQTKFAGIKTRRMGAAGASQMARGKLLGEGRAPNNFSSFCPAIVSTL